VQVDWQESGLARAHQTDGQQARDRIVQFGQCFCASEDRRQERSGRGCAVNQRVVPKRHPESRVGPAPAFSSFNGNTGRRGVCAGDRVGPPLLKGAHKLLCTRCPTEKDPDI
jgi:hypothetical protein